jgi:alanine dehydrogenase
MNIGVPREIKNHEYRVALTPDAVRSLTAAGHIVTVQTNAGAGVDFDDQQYLAAGARIGAAAEDVFRGSELIVKVKEPQAEECARLTGGQTLFTYLHLAADRAQAAALVKSGAAAIAYETVAASDGSLPLLTPMSEVAGRMSVQVGAYFLQKANGGRGVLLGGVPGVAPARVIVIGGGVAGTHAAEMALGLRASVTLFERSVARLRQLDVQFAGRARVLYSTAEAIAREIEGADLVIGAVLIPGAAAPKVVTRPMLRRLARGAVVVDIAIDQGGCFETSRPTSHADPVYIDEGVVHYCVTNMPGAVPRTSTLALSNVTLPYVHLLAKLGWRAAVERHADLRAGLNVADGRITHEAVARETGL